MLSRRKKLLKKGLLQTNEEKDGSSENGTRELDDMSGLVPVPVPFERSVKHHSLLGAESIGKP